MYEQMMEVLRRLLPQTKAGKVEWEHLADDEMVRTRVGKGLLRIGRETGDLQPENGPKLVGATYYPVWVIGPYGGVTDQFIVTPLEPRNYETVSELYQEARNRAVDSDQILESMIEALKAG